LRQKNYALTISAMMRRCDCELVLVQRFVWVWW